MRQVTRKSKTHLVQWHVFAFFLQTAVHLNCINRVINQGGNASLQHSSPRACNCLQAHRSKKSCQKHLQLLFIMLTKFLCNLLKNHGIHSRCLWTKSIPYKSKKCLTNQVNFYLMQAGSQTYFGFAGSSFHFLTETNEMYGNPYLTVHLTQASFADIYITRKTSEVLQ